MDFDVIGVPLEYKFADGTTDLPPGEFRGYGAIFGNTDYHKDAIAPGAFQETLTKRAAEGRGHVPMHVMHRFYGGDGLPIGVWKSVAEDDKGLRVHGKISGMNTDTGLLHYERLRDGAYRGMSIGYNALAVVAGKVADATKRLITKVHLGEISLVDDPANARAIFDEIKMRVGGDLDVKTVMHHNDAIQALVSAMALHRASTAGGDSPTAAERGQLFTHLQDAHEALTGKKMPDGMKSSATTEDFVALFLGMGVPADRAGKLAADALASAADRSGEKKAAVQELEQSLSSFRLPAFG